MNENTFIVNRILSHRESPQHQPLDAGADSLLRAAFDLAADGLVIVDADRSGLSIVRANARLAKICGLAAEQLCDRDLCDWVDAADRAGLRTLVASASENKEVPRGDFRFHDRNAQTWSCQVSVRRLGIDDKRSLVLLTCTDVSARVAQSAAHSSELRFRALMENSLDLMIVINARGEVQFINETGVRRLLGFGAQQMLGRSIFEFIHPDDIARTRESLALHMVDPGRAGRYTYELRARHADGSWRWVETLGANLLENPHVRGMVVNARDITDRKAAEAELQKSHEQLDSALNCANIGTWEFDIATSTIYFDSVCAGLMGSEPAPIVADLSWLQTNLDSEDIERARIALRVHLKGESPWYEVEYRMRAPDGARRWVYARGRASGRSPEGRVTRISGVLLDVDARKRAELSLLNTERRFDVAMSGANAALYTVNLQSNQAFHSSSWYQMTGFDDADWRSRENPWQSRLHPEDAGPVLKAVNDYLQGRCASYEVEYRYLTKSERWIWLFDRASIVERDALGRPVTLAGTLIDISARKLAEEGQRQSEFRYRSVADMTLGYVHESRFDAAAQSGYEVVWASKGFADVFGCSVEEYNRRGGMRAFYLPQDIANAEERVARLMRGERAEGEVRLLRADGTLRWLHAINEPIRHSGTGEVIGMLGVAHDITERKSLEHEIIEVANREQQRIGSDLHDGLGQELTGIALLLRSFSEQLAREYPQGRASIDEVIGIVNQTISGARALARGLSPVTLEHGGLVAALRGLAVHAKERYGLTVRYRSSAATLLQVDAATANHVYRIAQEALTNAARHSGASMVSLHLRVDANGLKLTISDNGAGMAAPADSQQGMGLRIMAYRSRMIGASLSIENRRDGGLQIRLNHQPLRDPAGSSSHPYTS